MGGAANQPKIDRSTAEKIVTERGWLAATSPGFQSHFLRLSAIVSFPKGATLFSTGDPAGGMYGLIEGALRVELPIPGRSPQVGHIAIPGFWVGAGSALQRRPREITLAASVDSTLFYLSISGCEAIAAADPDNLRHLVGLHFDNQRLILAAAKDLMNPSIPARTASRLLAIFGWTGENELPTMTEPVSITQSELAMMCNVSRKTVNRELANFVRLGLITQVYGGLILNDAEGLYRIAQGIEPDAVPPAGDR